MGNFYKKGVSHDELNRQFDEGMKLPKLLQEKDKIVEDMRRHLADKSCAKRKTQYLYELSQRDFAEWIAAMKDPCERYTERYAEPTNLTGDSWMFIAASRNCHQSEEMYLNL